MGINVKESKTGMSKASYPCLMQSDTGQIVLFTGHKTGTLLLTKGNLPVGYFCDAWASADFKLYNGTLELSNE